MTRTALGCCLAILVVQPVRAQTGGTTRDILVMNFATMASGSLPEFTGSLELVDNAGSRMLKASGAASFRVNLPEALPENFTLEFDLIPKECCSTEDLAFEGTLSRNESFARVSWGRVGQLINGGGSYFTATVPPTLSATLPGQLTHIMATFEGDLLRVYTNGQRLYTVSDRLFPRGKLLLVSLTGDEGQQEKGAVYLTRLRVAAGIATPGVTAVLATSTGTGMLSAPATASSSQPLTAGAAAVTGLSVVLDAQGKATLKWAAVPDATAYAAMRWNINDLSCCKNLSPSVTATQWDDGSLTDGTYGYRVYATTGSATVVGETRVTVKNGTITETIASAGSGNVAAPAPSPPPAPPAPTLDPARSIDRTSFNSAPPPPPPPPPPGTLDPARSITRTDFSKVLVLDPITGTPAQANLRWNWPDVDYAFEVWRKVGTSAPERRTPGLFQQAAFQDKIEDPRLTYAYQIKSVHYSDAQYEVSPWISFTPPPLINPSSFTGRLSGDKEATLSWQAVPGATSYRVDGPGLPTTGQMWSGSVLRINMLQPGAQTWQIASVYGDNLMDMTKRPSATVTIPSTWRTVPYLSMRNGTGSLVDEIAYYLALQESGMIKKCGAANPWDCLKTAYDLILSFPVVDTFVAKKWGAIGGSSNGRPVYEAMFADLHDMGAGRHVYCTDAGVAPAAETLCWASTHGPDPGSSGWGDLTTTLNSIQNGPNRSWTFIRRGVTGVLFAAADFITWSGGSYGDEQYGATKPDVVFDTEGKKRLPHACLACHGGRYDPISRKVLGASLIPLDPSRFDFPNRKDQEESIRRINMVVLNSSPSPAVAAYIKGLYRGTPEVAGTTADDNYLPAGWTQAPDLYRKVVKPYCQGCHLQQQTLDFATYQNFVDAKATILTSVCTTRTMPHSEAALVAFWRDGGSESLPDYLAGALGLGKCTP